MDETIVVFRKWKESKTIIALFPEIKDEARYCQSYEHVGQHGPASYQNVIQDTVPATQEEYQELFDELTEIGYNLKVKTRHTKK